MGTFIIVLIVGKPGFRKKYQTISFARLSSSSRILAMPEYLSSRIGENSPIDRCIYKLETLLS